MVQHEPCDSCSHADDCKRVYQQLGHTQSPSIALKVVVAFVLPVVVFTVALGLLTWQLQEVATKTYQSLLACVLALVVTAVFMGLVRLITTRLHKRAER
jgi:uncharacterized protein YqhQ